MIYTMCFKDLVLLKKKKKQSKAHHSPFPRWPFYSSWDSHLFFPQHMVTAVFGPLPFISSSGLESNQFWSIISFIQDSPSLQSLCLAGLTHTVSPVLEPTQHVHVHKDIYSWCPPTPSPFLCTVRCFQAASLSPTKLGAPQPYTQALTSRLSLSDQHRAISTWWVKVSLLTFYQLDKNQP